MVKKKTINRSMSDLFRHAWPGYVPSLYYQHDSEPNMYTERGLAL